MHQEDLRRESQPRRAARDRSARMRRRARD